MADQYSSNYIKLLRYYRRKYHGRLARHRRGVMRHSIRVAMANRAYVRKRLADKQWAISVLVIVPTLALITHMLMTLLSI
jgi:hypothetical protein